MGININLHKVIQWLFTNRELIEKELEEIPESILWSKTHSVDFIVACKNEETGRFSDMPGYMVDFLLYFTWNSWIINFGRRTNKTR